MNLERLIGPLRQRIMLMVSRAVVRLIDDDTKAQMLQVDLLAGESRRLERFGEYGFTSHPHPDAEAIAVFIGGNRDHGIVIAVGDRRYRLKGLEQGEVALYDDLGSRILLRRGGRIDVVSASEINLSSPTVKVSGDLVVEGDITDQASGDGISMDEMRTRYNAHTHISAGNGNPTSDPTPDM